MAKTLREIKRQARRDLHQHLLVPAVYLVPVAPEDEEDEVTYTEQVVTVRIHTKFDALGDLKGVGYAERQDTVPKILFMREQIDKPARHCIVSVEPGEAYRIDNVLPADDITVMAEVTKLTAAEADGLPLPDGRAPQGLFDDAYFTDDGTDTPYDPEEP